MILDERQLKKKLGKKIEKVNLAKPHLRWNHWINPKLQTGEFYFAIIGEREERENTRDFLISELNRIYGPVEELHQGGRIFKVSNSELQGILLDLQSPADPKLINFHKTKNLGIKGIIRDPTLYERVTPRDYHNIISRLEKIYS